MKYVIDTEKETLTIFSDDGSAEVVAIDDFEIRADAKHEVLTVTFAGVKRSLVDNKVVIKRAHLKKMVSFFSEETHIPMPSTASTRDARSASVRWFTPLRELYISCDGDLNETLLLIRASVTRMRENKLTISSPQSIRNVAIDIVATKQTRSKVLSVW